MSRKGKKGSKTRRIKRALKKAAPDSVKGRIGISGRTHLPYGYIEFGKRRK